jgi:hypothetical protein
MRNPIVRAFEALMARLGRPVTLINQSGRGRPRLIFKFENGETVMLRTNQNPALLVKQRGWRKNGPALPITAPLAFEDCHYVAAAFLNPDHPDRVTVYLIPSGVAAPELKRLEQAWMDADRSHDSNNRIFRIRFDDAAEGVGFTEEYGYAHKWAEYRLGDIELSAASSDRPAEATGELPAAILERHRQEIAAEFGVEPEAVEINVNLVYQGKDGKLRSAFVR